MSELEQQELISAYLDGEVTAEEQARIEELLVDSEPHRQLFNQLRSLRDSLQAIPAQRLDAGFADRVLQQAERRMLEPSPDKAASVADSNPGKVVKPDTTTAGSEARHWTRRAIITSITVAAALLIAMFFGPWNGADNNTSTNVARRDDASQRPQAKPAESQTFANGQVELAQGETATDEEVEDQAESGPNGRPAVVTSVTDEHQLQQQARVSRRVAQNKAGVPGSTGFGGGGTFAGAAITPEQQLAKAADNLSVAGQPSHSGPSAPVPLIKDAVTMDAKVTMADQPFLVVVDVPQDVMATDFVNKSLATNGIAMMPRLEQQDGISAFGVDRFRTPLPADEDPFADSDSEDAGQLATRALNRGRNHLALELPKERTPPAADVLVVTAGIDQIEATCDRLATLGCSISVHRESKSRMLSFGGAVDESKAIDNPRDSSVELLNDVAEFESDSETLKETSEGRGVRGVLRSSASNATEPADTATPPEEPSGSPAPARPQADTSSFRRLVEKDKMDRDDANDKSRTRVQQKSDGAATAPKANAPAKGKVEESEIKVSEPASGLKNEDRAASYAYRAGRNAERSKQLRPNETPPKIASDHFQRKLEAEKAATADELSRDDVELELLRRKGGTHANQLKQHSATISERLFAKLPSSQQPIRVIFVFRPVPDSAVETATKASVVPAAPATKKAAIAAPKPAPTGEDADAGSDDK